MPQVSNTVVNKTVVSLNAESLKDVVVQIDVVGHMVPIVSARTLW